MLACSLLLAVSAAAHPESLSRSRIAVRGSEAEVELRFQSLSLIEVQPQLDPRPDGAFDPQELEGAREAIVAYLLRNFRLYEVRGEREEPLPGSVVGLALAEDAGGADDLQWLEARFAFRSGSALEVLTVESHLFHETNPWHRDSCSVAWNDEGEVWHTFRGGDTRWRFEPGHVRRPGVLATFVRLGVEHILGGYDHLAFLVALLVASRRLKTLVAVVTAFTLAHSITLAAAALGWVKLPSRFIELAIALSIAYVATENLLRRDPRNPWIEAFGFGLLHGLGFAGFLADALAGEQLLLTAVVGFNLGVELGQLAVVLACVLVLALVFRRWRRERTTEGLAPRPFCLAASALVAVSGFYWFAERAGWL